jgi:hypothetical protein
MADDLSIEDAVSQLMGGAEGDNQDDNLRETADSILDIPSDDLGDDQEIDGGEGADDGELSADMIDDEESDPEGEEIDDEDEEDFDEDSEDDEDGDTTKLFTVKIDGKEEQWTQDQLLQSAAGQGKITKGLQEVAEGRKALEAEASTLAQARQAITEAVRVIEAGTLNQPPQPPDASLMDSDPFRYQKEKHAYDLAVAEYNAGIERVQEVQRQQAAEDAETHQARLKEQVDTLILAIPELGDPEKAPEFNARLAKAGEEIYGFTKQELSEITDARVIIALNDARKFRDLEKKRAKADAKAKPKPKRRALRAGKTKIVGSRNRKAAQERLKQTGSLDDAVSLIMDQ